MIIKHPGKRSLKSYCDLLLVNSGNYYLKKLTADVYEGNITYDVCNCITYIDYNANLSFKNVSNHENMFTLFCSFKKFDKNIYLINDILRNVHIKYGCGYSRT